MFKDIVWNNLLVCLFPHCILYAHFLPIVSEHKHTYVGVVVALCTYGTKTSVLSLLNLGYVLTKWSVLSCFSNLLIPWCIVLSMDGRKSQSHLFLGMNFRGHVGFVSDFEFLLVSSCHSRLSWCTCEGAPNVLQKPAGEYRGVVR